ncbi:MAG: alkaline phosphatase family protein [Vicinamibacterales bacterium]
MEASTICSVGSRVPTGCRRVSSNPTTWACCIRLRSSPPTSRGAVRSDPDHSYEGGRIDLNGGHMNGFLLNTGRATANDDFAIGYYGEEDRAFFNSFALNYTTFDNFFSPILAETYPNRIFMHAAQTDRLTNTLTISTLPTIWDRLKAKGVSARYYRSDFSFLWLWGTKYDSITFSARDASNDVGDLTSALRSDDARSTGAGTAESGSADDPALSAEFLELVQRRARPERPRAAPAGPVSALPATDTSCRRSRRRSSSRRPAASADRWSARYHSCGLFVEPCTVILCKDSLFALDLLLRRRTYFGL